MAEYKVQFEVFEGPLDLLLYLVKKEEVDIYEVNLTNIAKQFIEYVDLMRELDLDIAGEFLVMASTLMYIKSRELLPKDQQAQVEGEEDEEDPRWELIRQLVEYKKFKDAAARLQEMEIRQEDVYPRLPGRPQFDDQPLLPKAQLSIFDLVNAVTVILKRFGDKQDQRDIFEDRWTVSEKIEKLMAMVKTRSKWKFSDLFEGATSRTEVVVTFLAMLELIRMKQLIITQPEPFSDIEIEPAPPPEIAAPAPATGDAAVAPAPVSEETNLPAPTSEAASNN